MKRITMTIPHSMEAPLYSRLFAFYINCILDGVSEMKRDPSLKISCKQYACI